MTQLPREPELSLLSVDELRRQLNLTSSAAPLPIERVEEVAVELTDRSLRARVYANSQVRDLPTVLYFHGGGFVVGTLDTHDAVCRRLCADTGAAIVSLDYRLAPEHGYPAATEDAYAAALFLSRHGDRIGVDGTRLAVAGDSAGGNLATVTCLLARDRGGPSIRHQLLIYPVTDAACSLPSYALYGDGQHGLTLTTDLMRHLWRTYLAGQLGDEATASPLRAALAGLPSATVITAEYDALRDEGVLYAQRLRDAGVEVEHRNCADLIHGFAAMWPSVDSAREALRFGAERLKLALV